MRWTARHLARRIRVPDVVERGESLMSNLAPGAGSDLDGHHDALRAGGGTPRAALYGITLSSKCGSMVGGGLTG